MLPLIRILSPTDFSQPSFEALKAANELALHFSAELFMVHVLSPAHLIVPFDFSMAAPPLRMEQMKAPAAYERLDSVARATVSKQVKGHIIITNGEPAAGIIRTAKERGIDLIIMATHGLTGWRHLLFGSVAERVVRSAPCTVLTIRPQEGESKELKHVA